MATNGVTLARAAAAAGSLLLTVYVLSLRRERKPHIRPGLSEASLRLLRQGQRNLLRKLLDVGGFFGVDIGGSLTKLVFFLPDENLVEKMLRRTDPAHAAVWRTKLASIRQIATFIKSSTRYGATGVRDAHLSFHMTDLGGSFHFIRQVARSLLLVVCLSLVVWRSLRKAGLLHRDFIVPRHARSCRLNPTNERITRRFETRRMRGALRLASEKGLNRHMHTICATGGGAVKVSAVTSRLPVDEAGVQPPGLLRLTRSDLLPLPRCDNVFFALLYCHFFCHCSSAMTPRASWVSSSSPWTKLTAWSKGWRS